MTKELKIWLENKQAIIVKLRSLGGVYKGKVSSRHTYFNQPDGRVLKLIDMDGEVRIDVLQRKGKQFVFVDKKPVNDKRAALQAYTAKFGVKTTLIMHAERYQLESYNVSLYDIENVGHFLILTGENPTLEQLERWFGLTSPKLVTVSFDNL